MEKDGQEVLLLLRVVVLVDCVQRLQTLAVSVLVLVAF